jgi:leucyl aminopeptidase
MHAKNFYQTSTDNAIPLMLLSKAQWSKDIEGPTQFERACLASQAFEGCLGNIGILTNTEGKPCRIYVGAGENVTDAIAIANAVNFLPVGCYVAEQPLSHGALLAWSLAQYRFDKYKACTALPRLLIVNEQSLPAVMADAAAVFLVRDLINTPTNDLGPKELADVVASVADQYGATFKQWVGDELLRDNFPAIHAVGRASDSAPRLLSLVWGQEDHPKVTLVGKGVCFDSGGLDIKPGAGMRLMKKDMGGAAQVIGLAQWLMTHEVPIRLHVLIPAVENSIDGKSYRPGDVLTMRNGMTVEIHDTDAEGRLVLADALVKACEEKPELLIDFATLTGAARVAVGTDIAALFSNNDNVANELANAALETNDPMWRMPLFEGYADYFNSSIADCLNASPIPYAGAITAALFLQRFIASDVPWAHFDIMAWNLGNKPGRPEGGEAMGVRAVGHYLRAKYS